MPRSARKAKKVCHSEPKVKNLFFLKSDPFSRRLTRLWRTQPKRLRMTKKKKIAFSQRLIRLWRTGAMTLFGNELSYLFNHKFCW